MRAIGMEVDACDDALTIDSIFMLLEQKVPTVVVERIRAMEPLQHEIGVLIRLRLRRLDFVRGGGEITGREREHRAVDTVPIEPARCT